MDDLASTGCITIQELSCVLLRCLTIHGCFRTSVRGKRLCGSSSYHSSNYGRVMSAPSSANYPVRNGLLW